MSLFDKPKLTPDPTGTILLEISKCPAELREVFFDAIGLEPDQQILLANLLRRSAEVVVPAARDALCEKIEEIYCTGCGETHEEGCVCNDDEELEAEDDEDEEDEEDGEEDAEEDDEDDDEEDEEEDEDGTEGGEG